MSRFRILKALGCAVLMSFSTQSQADVVEVVGQAPLDGSPAEARERALKDALHQASLQGNSRVSAIQMMQHGEIVRDDVAVSTQSSVKDVQILWEDSVDGMYQLALRADVTPQGLCPVDTPNYRKAIAIAGFGLAQPQQATLGRLENAEQALPRWLAGALNQSGQLRVLDATRISLYQDPRRAPSAETAQQRLTTSVALATQLGAQYVISGVIRDMDVHQKKQRAQGSLLGAMFSRAHHPRDFVMDVFIHDGLSGAMLYQQTYRTQGLWDARATDRTGFATPDFWATAYGSAVETLLDDVSDDVSEVLRCQPFMARIVRARGNRLHIEATASAGIRPGDTFKVYRTGTLYNLDLEPRTELTDMAAEAVVKQVQPQFIIADLSYPAETLSIQRDDMVIAW